MIVYLSVDQILALLARLVDEFGGLAGFAIADRSNRLSHVRR